MIHVSKPYLPPLIEYNKWLKKIWNQAWITNNGPLLTELEVQLKSYLHVENLQVVSSGTVALQIAIEALGLKGEVITTAFSHVSTANTIIWKNIKPVFADIGRKTLCIDPYKIEAAITEQTSGILATHVFGYPCNVRQIESIAKKYHLKVLYDGAHAFGVKIGNESVFNFGDISIVSFHATKFYHMVEGGAIISKDRDLSEKCNLLRNFGQDRNQNPVMAGINGKASELHAAMGLCNLSKVPDFIKKLKELSGLYRYLLKDLHIEFMTQNAHISYNYSYFPIIFSSQEKMMMIKNSLNSAGIYPRRYFFPPLNDLPYVEKSACPVAENISHRILCLPLYYDLSMEDVEMIAQIISDQFHHRKHANTLKGMHKQII